MPDVTTELGNLIAAQQKQIHYIVHQLESAEGQLEDTLDLLLDRHVRIREILYRTLESILNIGDEEDELLQRTL
jgi:hypothetical protein